MRYHFRWFIHRNLLQMYPQPIPFIIANWPLVLVLVVSGSMLIWPLLQGHLSRVREVGAVAATQLINRQNAVILDLREPSEFAAGRLPNALHIPSSQLAQFCETLSTVRAGSRVRQLPLPQNDPLRKART